MIERLETSFNKQNQFISDVSHELKTPISVISEYANLLDRWGIETNRNIYSSNNEECYIVADIIDVKELIRIIIDNAIKYTDENGEINIFSQKDNGKIYINIQDNGIGIAEEEQENIFDRFYRIDKSRNKETGGVGLGLAIAKSIANMNKAEIKLERKQVKGSTFTLIFSESLINI